MNHPHRCALNVVFGAMTFGKKGAEQVRVHEHQAASEILDIFQKHGHHDIDTARLYGQGSSEEMLAHLEWQKRGLVMHTKYFPTASVPSKVPSNWDVTGRHTPEGLRANLMNSLKALKTDKVELWYLHGPDRSTPYEVTMKAVNELHQEGSFKRLGLSNYMAWEVAQICELCRANGWKQPDVYEGMYNALHRAVEPELFSCIRNYGMAFYAYNPLAGGYLTDRYQRDQADNTDGRFDPSKSQGKVYRERYWNDEYFGALELLRLAAQKHNLTEAECALRWLVHHSQLTRECNDSVIIGASSTHHIEQNLIDLEKAPLPEDVVEALSQGWERCRGISIKYWY